MPKSATEDYTRSSDKQRSLSRSTTGLQYGKAIQMLCVLYKKNEHPVFFWLRLDFISLATGIVLSGITGAGILLIVVALTENCRAMLVYLLVATIVWLGLVSLAITKIGRACIRFKDAPKIKDEDHRLANLACVSGLLTFLGAVLYFFSIVVVFSFYHFRYVRRAILLHENECE
ncbi:hypothetical protein HF086_001572 [Spodoptera exigua]|uniref:Uncharacterized protein n=1 Tax=Spodoptera exigua TaxID=7107 RepID=A0A922MQ30_SPOEX|nr:hypothetical protein HF086_001572 [Spodoptera exigua]